MFVCSLKVQKLKAVALSILCAAVLGTALTFMLGNGSSGEDLAAAAVSGRNIRFDGIKTDEDMTSFISSLGIEVKLPAIKSTKVDLPRVFDAVYAKYNDIQKQQGFDLSKYCGKTLDRYTWEMTNYPTPTATTEEGKTNTEAPKVYLTLFRYKDKIVGGDISSRDNGGFVTTFVDFKPSN
ncbi:MAG: DUF4830 domain-containing protein [Ruminococcaceae bacterium]|nr:DUF4830 domain-containing protein [Oscillospiraceae bacterium]